MTEPQNTTFRNEHDAMVMDVTKTECPIEQSLSGGMEAGLNTDNTPFAKPRGNTSPTTRNTAEQDPDDGPDVLSETTETSPKRAKKNNEEKGRPRYRGTAREVKPKF
jgi:hypothetical protein